MYLPEDMHRYLMTEGARRGVSMAEIAREAIAHYRATTAAEAQADPSAIIGITCLGDAATDDASHVDEILGAYYEVGGAWDEEHPGADTD